MYCLLQPGFKKISRLLFAVKLKHVCLGCGLIFIFDFFGLFTHVFELPFDENFVYPYQGDVHEFVAALRHNEKPALAPINTYNHTFVHDVRDKCLEPEFQAVRLVLLVKSAVQHFARRMAIRNSWGFEARFSDVPIKTVFLLGSQAADDNEARAKVEAESATYRDLVQADFIDSYYNNTIKTMTGFRWAQRYCSNSKYYMFVDDDMYVSVKNVLRFLRNPTLYPDYLKDSVKLDKRDAHYYSKPRVRERRQVFDFELPDDARLFAGFVFKSAPHRHKSSKWYVSLKEYPYHLWPPYVTAGAYVLSKEALLDMYFASMYTKHFRFDDIFLALVAKKADIEPLHCEEFHFHKKDYTVHNYKYVLSSHGYGDPDELLRVWNEQKALGNA